MNWNKHQVRSCLSSLIAFSCLLSPACNSQDLRAQRLSFNAGTEWHGAPSSNGFNISQIIHTNHPGYCGGAPCIPYHYEKNLQGFGLTGGIAYRFMQLDFNIGMEMRYDVIYYSYDVSQNIWTYYKEFIFNPKLGVQKWLGGFRRPQYVGVSYKIINTGKKFDFYDNIENTNKTFYLQTPSALVQYGRSFGESRVFGEFMLYYFYKGLPHNPNGPFFMYGLAAYYRFQKPNRTS